MTYSCKYCGKDFITNRSKGSHEGTCKSNRNLIPRNYTRSEDYLNRMRKSNRNRWTEEERRKKSNRMLQAVLDNPDSYSKNNVSGRVKVYEVNSSAGITKVKGKWELKVAEFLNINKIKWTNNITPFSYFWNEKWHLYFPDFYLIDSDKFIEVKGYRTDRDLEKWKSVNKELIIIDKSNIDNLREILRG